MKNLRSAAAGYLTVPALFAFAALASPAAAQGINVYVDREAIAFPGQPPVQTAGTVLVPLRGVFEKLGAYVQYDSAAKTILATKGTTSVTLRLGDSQAFVNGIPRALSVPAQAVSGTTLVPLRFVSEALGADVRWESSTRSVLIDTGAAPGGAPPVAQPAYTERRGEVRTVRALSSGVTLVTLTDGSVIEVASTAPVTIAGRAAAIADIRPGDDLVLRVNPQTQQAVSVAVGAGSTTPSPTPTPTPTPDVRLNATSLTHSATRTLREDDVLTVTLRGTPGATARFTIPGFAAAAAVAMRETSPGVYTGTFTIPGNTTIKGAAVLASLTKGTSSSPTLQAATALTIDSVGPSITGISPADKAVVEQNRPLIYATYTDAGTGINTDQVLMTLDRNQVAPQAITGAFVNYTPPAPLSPGTHTATLQVADLAGNTSRASWTFTVGQSAATALSSVATSVPAGTALRAGQTLTVTARGVSGGSAVFDIGGSIKDVPMRETSNGVYTGTYVVKQGDSLAGAPVTVRFRTPDGRTVTQAAAQPISIATGAPSAPVIDTPQAGATTGGTVTVSGRATPGSTVRLVAIWQGRLLILPQQATFAEREVKVGTDGRWSVPDLELPQPFGVSGLTYTVAVASIDAAGQESDPATVTFKR